GRRRADAPGRDTSLRQLGRGQRAETPGTGRSGQGQPAGAAGRGRASVVTKPALLGGEPVTRAADWPTWPQWDDREREALADVLESGRWQAGPQVEAFEAEFAAYQGASNALAVTNGTSSMVMVLRAAGVGPGDEVIIPSYTFIATALAPMALG